MNLSPSFHSSQLNKHRSRRYVSRHLTMFVTLIMMASLTIIVGSLSADASKGKSARGLAGRQSSATERKLGAKSVAAVLNADGSLRPGIDGSFDVRGFRMEFASDGAPRFVPAAPDGDTQFGVNAVTEGVYALAVMGSDLYVGGAFTTIEIIAANRIAKFNTTTGVWSTLSDGNGNGVNSAVRALAVMGNDLFVGGEFTIANFGGNGATPAIGVNNIAKFSTTANTWSALSNGNGNGVNGTVEALAVLGSDLYAGGYFTTANVGGFGGTPAVTANRVAKFNTTASTWSALSNGNGNGLDDWVQVLAVMGTDLYVGGHFTTANVGGSGGTPPIIANNIAKFDTTTGVWSALSNGNGNGVNSTVRALAFMGSNLYAGGDFTTTNVGGSGATPAVTANKIVKFNTATNTWSALGNGVGNGLSDGVSAVAVMDTDLYVGGLFRGGGGGAPTFNIVKFDTTTNTWGRLGSGPGLGVNNQVYALAVIGSELYVGGTFTIANYYGPVPYAKPAEVPVRYIARFYLPAGWWAGPGCPKLVVTNSNDSGAGSLRDIINRVGCLGGEPSQITFDMTPGHVTSPITLTSGGLLIQDEMSIQGPGASLLTIAGNNTFRLIDAQAGTVSISGLSFTGGGQHAGSRASVIEWRQGAGSLTLTNCEVFGNSGVSAIYALLAGQLNVNGCTFHDNLTGNVVTSDRTLLSVANSTFSGNSGIAIHTATATLGVCEGPPWESCGYVRYVTSSIGNSTITNNGAGIQSDYDLCLCASTVNVSNTLLSNNGNLNLRKIGSATIGSSGHNLIDDATAAAFKTTDATNIIIPAGTALLGSLANNSGPTQTHALLPGSPAINAGSSSGTDQRGISRVGVADIGAFESRGFTIAASSGSGQSAPITTAFTAQLVATVSSAFGEPVAGGVITFTAPGSGPSGTFPGNITTARITNDASGVATSPIFTANNLAGSYNVTAGANGAASSASFSLTNTKSGSSTIVSSSPNPSDLGQQVTFTATVTSAAGTPAGTVQFRIDSVSSGGPLTLNGSGVAQLTTSSLTAGTHTVTADYGGDTNFNPSSGALLNSQVVNNRPLVSFSLSNYSVNEADESVMVTVNRTGDTAVPVTVDYATDDTGAPNLCSALNSGMASARCDFGVTLGTLKLAAGETQKTFVIPITQDSYAGGPEMFTVNLSNLTGANAALATPSSATVTINDSIVPAPNAIDDTDAFVCMQYHDFLNRDPDPEGLAFWSDNINKCNDPARRPAGLTLAQCIEVMRINTSAAFFLSIEFQTTGILVRNFYVAALDRPLTNNMPGFVEFERDTQAVQHGVIVGQGNWQQTLNDNRDAFMKDFVLRAEFVGLYPTTDTPTQYVDKLYMHAAVTPATPAERQAAIDEFIGTTHPSLAEDAGARGRALLRVTQNAAFQQREMNRSFVQMEYFGYLRRNPNDAPDGNSAGYDFWLNKLNQFNGNFVQAEMVKAFISSSEYRQRFGP